MRFLFIISSEGQTSEASDASEASDEPRSGEPPALKATHEASKINVQQTNSMNNKLYTTQSKTNGIRDTKQNGPGKCKD